MGNRLQRINNAVDQLNALEDNVRDMIKDYLWCDVLTGTSEDNPMTVDIAIEQKGSFDETYYPRLTAMWKSHNDIIFEVDEIETEFEYMPTAELSFIINRIKI